MCHGVINRSNVKCHKSQSKAERSRRSWVNFTVKTSFFQNNLTSLTFTVPVLLYERKQLQKYKIQPLKKYISTFSNVAGEIMTLSNTWNRSSLPENVSELLEVEWTTASQSCTELSLSVPLRSSSVCPLWRDYVGALYARLLQFTPLQGLRGGWHPGSVFS